ncbi:MAG: serine acetyltransferase [Cytophagaceae bacterium]|nr:serine acetyltransferase [Cytophagaceae bacterium]
MNKDFINKVYNKHLHTEKIPSTSSVCKLITKILLTLFPEQAKRHFNSQEELIERLNLYKHDLQSILELMQSSLPDKADVLADKFMDLLSEVYEDLTKDIEAIVTGDPAAKNEYEVVRAYPGFYAIAFYRLAHALYRLNIPLLPRILTEYAHSKTGIDIHPAAEIAPYLFIDHGTGVVIGETAKIGKHVKIYQGVTLGALSVSKKMAETKRHPTIEDHVVIYSGATILGGDTIVGHNSIIGGNVWLTNTVPPYSRVYHKPQIEVSKSGKLE